MGAVDNGAKLRAAVLAAIDKQCLGEDYGFDAAPSLGQGPNGVVVLYTLIVTKRSPLLGHGPLVHAVNLPTPAPTAEQIEQAITEAMKGLRELSTKLLTDSGQKMPLTSLEALRTA